MTRGNASSASHAPAAGRPPRRLPSALASPGRAAGDCFTRALCGGIYDTLAYNYERENEIETKSLRME